MKRPGFPFFILLASFLFTVSVVRAQEETESKFQIGTDVYTNYIWRGSKLGTGPSLQPSIEFTTGKRPTK